MCVGVVFRLRSGPGGFRSRHGSTSLLPNAGTGAASDGALGDWLSVGHEAEETEGPQSVLSFRRLIERESVSELIAMVSTSDMQGKTNAAIALGHLARDRELNGEVR